MKKRIFSFWSIFLITLLALFIDIPEKFTVKGSFGKFQFEKEIKRPIIDFKIGSFQFRKELKIVQGLDLQGGTRLVFEALMDQIPQEERKIALEATRQNIERRVNFFGVSEPVIQTAQSGDSSRIIVELPGIKDINQAIDLIGQTAQLEFWEENPDPQATKSGQFFVKTDLTGKDLKKSQVSFDNQTGQPVVGLEFTQEGAKKFAQITQKNVGKTVAIYLDGIPVSAPKVEEPILEGKAVIKGNFNLKQAKQLSIQLNAGALPVPIKIIEQKNIGASLGQDSVKKSVQAGLIGLLLVIIFMALYYGKLGILADIALIIYGLLTLALYKLIPVTLTLPGLAGFLLTVGMAVDSNILIFERMKEELRTGKPLPVAMELGFGRAWDSIRDANVCTLIIAFILFNPLNWSFLNVSGMVRGFALTLILGTILSLFTGIVISRTLIRIFYQK